jgi:hypothetical protein
LLAEHYLLSTDQIAAALFPSRRMAESAKGPAARRKKATTSKSTTAAKKAAPKREVDRWWACPGRYWGQTHHSSRC